jgi:hypothetical protein
MSLKAVLESLGLLDAATVTGHEMASRYDMAPR